MIDLALTVLDVARWALLGALFAGTAWLALRTLREARWLDDRPTGPESPGTRNDRAALRQLRQWGDQEYPSHIVGEPRRPR